MRQWRKSVSWADDSHAHAATGDDASAHPAAEQLVPTGCGIEPELEPQRQHTDADVDGGRKRHGVRHPDWLYEWRF